MQCNSVIPILKSTFEKSKISPKPEVDKYLENINEIE